MLRASRLGSVSSGASLAGVDIAFQKGADTHFMPDTIEKTK